jgi:hypothetical protein
MIMQQPVEWTMDYEKKGNSIKHEMKHTHEAYSMRSFFMVVLPA